MLPAAACCDVPGQRREKAQLLQRHYRLQTLSDPIHQVGPCGELRAWGSWVVPAVVGGQVPALSAWWEGQKGEVREAGTGGGTGASAESRCLGQLQMAVAWEQKETQREGGLRDGGLGPRRLPSWRDKIRSPGAWLEARWKQLGSLSCEA